MNRFNEIRLGRRWWLLLSILFVSCSGGQEDSLAGVYVFRPTPTFAILILQPSGAAVISGTRDWESIDPMVGSWRRVGDRIQLVSD